MTKNTTNTNYMMKRIGDLFKNFIIPENKQWVRFKTNCLKNQGEKALKAQGPKLEENTKIQIRDQ